jgi:hypothetical membrane protein
MRVTAIRVLAALQVGFYVGFLLVNAPNGVGVLEVLSAVALFVWTLVFCASFSEKNDKRNK